MPIQCPSCSAFVPAQSHACAACGLVLPAEVGPPESRTERRQLSVMFCDLVNSSNLARSLDPEDLLELYRAYQEACGSIVSSRGGYVAEYLGDGIVVYFGYPAAREGDERRAVQAALSEIETQATFQKYGLLAEGSTPQELHRIIGAELAKWSRALPLSATSPQ